MAQELSVKLEKIKGNSEMVSLVKQTAVSLEKRGINLNKDVAKVALCLDFSGSMSGLVSNGTVSEVIKRSLAQAIALDDDGDIEVFGFGSKAKYMESIDISTFERFSEDVRRGGARMGGTEYAEAIDLIESFYDKEGYDVPVFVIFVTDGDTSSKDRVVRSMIRSSNKPIFWQFIGIGAEDYDPSESQPSATKHSGGFLSRLLGGSNSPVEKKKTSFTFLEKLDEMEGRTVDNAGFFAISDPKNISAERMYDLLNNEYPEWLLKIREKGMIK